MVLQFLEKCIKEKILNKSKNCLIAKKPIKCNGIYSSFINHKQHNNIFQPQINYPK